MLVVATDHKLLCLKGKTLNIIDNPRLVRLLDKTMIELLPIINIVMS